MYILYQTRPKNLLFFLVIVFLIPKCPDVGWQWHAFSILCLSSMSFTNRTCSQNKLVLLAHYSNGLIKLMLMIPSYKVRLWV